MPSTSPRRAVVVEIMDPGAPWAEVVVSAAAQLFHVGDPVEVVLSSPDDGDPSPQLADLVRRWVTAAVEDAARLPEMLLAGRHELGGRDELVRVATGTSAAEAARATVLLAGAAFSLEVPAAPAAAPARRHDGLEDAVLFSSFSGERVACNPLAIAEHLAAAGHGAKRYFLVPDSGTAAPQGCVPVVKGSTEHRRVLSTSRWLVDNQQLPTGFTKARGQTILQTWHGTALKKLMRDLHEVAPRPAEVLAERARDAAQWDVALSPNPLMSKVLVRGLGAGGRVLEHGYPRNDVLADPVRRAAAALRVRTMLEVPSDQPVVMYAPTWRDTALCGYGRFARYVEQPTPDWAALRGLLPGGVTILSRRHRFLPLAPFEEPHVIDVSEWPDMTDLLAATDVLVTDYSSSFFDFALTGRPMVFFTYDLEDYRGASRGHYFQMEDVVPGPMVSTPRDVAEAVAAAVHDPLGVLSGFGETYCSFKKRFNPWDDGDAARRVAEEVFA